MSSVWGLTIQRSPTAWQPASINGNNISLTKWIKSMLAFRCSMLFAIKTRETPIFSQPSEPLIQAFLVLLKNGPSGTTWVKMLSDTSEIKESDHITGGFLKRWRLFWRKKMRKLFLRYFSLINSVSILSIISMFARLKGKAKKYLKHFVSWSAIFVESWRSFIAWSYSSIFKTV